MPKKANKKINKKKLLIFLIILCIVIIIISIIILQILGMKPKKNTSAMVVPFSAILFEEEYTGEIPESTFYKELYTISDYLSNLSKDLKKQSDLEKNYKKRKNELEGNLGIEELLEFKDLANYLKAHDVSETELAYCSYERNSLVKNTYYSDFGMKFVYKNEQEIELKVKFLNKRYEEIC